MSALKEQLKVLQAKKQYDAMITLLEASDEPNKRQIIDRIKARMAADTPAPIAVKTAALPVKAKAKPRYSWRGVFILVMFTLSLMCGIQTIIWWRQNQEAGKLISIRYAMASVCRDVFEQKYFDDRYTAAQYVDGCMIAAQHSISEYGQEINYCYDNYDQTDAIFMKCLADNDVKMSDIWLINAPKE